MKRTLPTLLLASVASSLAADITVPADIYPILDKVYSWQAARLEPHNNQSIIGWKHSAFYTGVMDLHEVYPDPKYPALLTQISADHTWRMLEVNGDLWRHADNHLMGETYIRLYVEEGEVSPIRIFHTTQIFDRMIANPWPGRQIYDWCDALFMSPPVWALLAAVKGDNKYLTELDSLWWDATDYLYNPTWNLYYRDKTYFNSVEPNGKPVFWGRGNGWVIGGLVRILKYMPQDWPGRPQYINLFKDMCARLAEIQMASGGWPSSLLYPEKYNFDTEVSGTSFFVYGITYGINSGILDRTTYGPVVEKGWEIMNANLNEDGSISNIQTVGKEPQPNDDLVDKREYGYGAFILAGVQMAEYYSATTGGSWSGWPVTESSGQRWADTGGFMGWLEVTGSPYVYSQSLAGWTYIMESDSIQQNGSWVYIFNN